MAGPLACIIQLISHITKYNTVRLIWRNLFPKLCNQRIPEKQLKHTYINNYSEVQKTFYDTIMTWSYGRRKYSKPFPKTCNLRSVSQLRMTQLMHWLPFIWFMHFTCQKCDVVSTLSLVGRNIKKRVLYTFWLKECLI